MKTRSSGILLHVSSLPSPFGIGDLGPEAYRFIDFLADAKQSLWQILPLNPTETIYYNSPYHSVSAFAGNPLFISPELLVRENLLAKNEIEPLPNFPQKKVDYPAVVDYKTPLLQKAFTRFKDIRDDEYERFCSREASWLKDFSLFTALKSRFPKKRWNEWPPELRDRNPEALETARQELAEKIDWANFLQYTFFKQWVDIKDYCGQKNIQIFGDIPIYVQHDSVDIWTNPELFKLDDKKNPAFIAGVPPDYFSATGQLWGNPVYNWEAHRQTGCAWWIKRIAHNLKLFDLTRIDHFRGLVAYWEVAAGEKTAVNGRWIEAPARELFTRLSKKFPSLPIVAEDLGIITPDVREVMVDFELPGMKILLFAFGEDMPANPYIPHNLPKNCIAYTGTHDNNTARGWFEKEADPETKKRLFKYLGRKVSAEEFPREMIRLLMMSAANLAIIPLQDHLGLNSEARMNFPSTVKGNWSWRLLPEQLTPELTNRIREMTEIYGRG